MKMHEALIAWTPTWSSNDKTKGQVKVGPLVAEGEADWTDPFACTGGAAWIPSRALRGDESLINALLHFHSLVVRDGIDPQVAHQAFLAVDEYAEAIGEDIGGARPSMFATTPEEVAIAGEEARNDWLLNAKAKGEA
jgi:hypothetical protein